MRSKPWEDPPHGVSEAGAKLWLDEAMTKYAEKDQTGAASVWPGLKGYQVLYALLPNDVRTRILTFNGAVKYESQSLEGMADMIDVLKFIQANPD
jgi:hypothetical protein